MADDDSKKTSVPELKVKRIVSFLPNSQEINAAMMARIYTGDPNGITWLDSRLDGILCFISDYQLKTFFIIMYDNFTFEKLFQYELYHESYKKAIICAPGFLSIEVEAGFLGFLFEKTEEADGFLGVLKKFGAFGANLFQGRMPGGESMKNIDKAKTYLNNIKERFITDEMKKYDENFADDGIEIVRSRNVEILGPIYYDETLGKFQFEDLTDELKMIFKMNGIKKKDLEDVELGYSIIKKIILIVSGNEVLKEKVFGAQTIHWDRPDEEKKIPVKKNEIHEDLLPDVKPKPKPKVPPKAPRQPARPPQPRHQPIARPPPQKPISSVSTPSPAPAPHFAPHSVPHSVPHAVPHSVPSAPKQPSVPNKPVPAPTSVPSVPAPPVPAPPTAPPLLNVPAISEVPTLEVNNTQEEAQEESKPQMSMEEQLKSVKLKKVEKKVEEKLVTTSEKTFLQAALSNAIANRRRNLMQHEDENSDDDEDW